MNVNRPSGRRIVQVIALVLILVVVVPLLLYVIGQLVPYYGGYVVLSNSMTPDFHSGDVVFVQQNSPSAVQINDTITYHTPNSRGTTTHKVVDIVEEGNQTLFQTQGIANEEPDPYLVPPRAYVGKVMFSVPLLGVLITFLQTDLGIVLFVLAPLSMLIVSESWDLAVAYFGSPSDVDEEAATERSASNRGESAGNSRGEDPIADFDLSSVDTSTVFDENWSEGHDQPDADASDDETPALHFEDWIAFSELGDTESGDEIDRREQ